MSVWEITNDRINDVAGVGIPATEEGVMRWWDKFGGSGSPLQWRRRPKLELLVGRGRKKPKPRADLSPFMPGALVLNAKARKALGEFLAEFGQLLEVDVQGEIEFFYNVTHILACIDGALSTRRPEGTIAREVFDPVAIPTTAAVFKDPLNLGKIYVNDAGRVVLESLVVTHGITGMNFRQAGG